MRTVPAGLQAHLDGEATTLCNAWRVVRRDGVVLGFTDHDRDLDVDGLTYLAASGFEASETEDGNGLSAEGGDVSGGFSADAITAEDLSAGRYDGAKVEVFLVNWQATGQRLLLRTAELGEVRREGGLFRAELRRLTHKLDQVKGRIYGRQCDAVLGDARCGVNLAAYRATATVSAVTDDMHIEVTGLSGFAERFFRYGVLSFTGGAAAGLSADIEDHRKAAGADSLTLWLPMAAGVAAGDTLQVTAGCDKRFSTCKAKFNNRLNFQGFPHMPGSDFSYGYADGQTVHDGRPLYG
ncbi:UNVERIFIED_ORG: putative phage protein (TIGR02218 family) [Shinella zoogloeoides]|nr:putative phage protein (TIGR02218 family) [Shinella zoogloeoides]